MPQELNEILSRRRIMKDRYLIMDPEALFWVVGNKNIEQNRPPYSTELANCLSSQVYATHNRVELELIELHLTQRCNLDCEYCYVPPQFRKDSEFMEYEAAECVIDKAVKYFAENGNKKPFVMFHGGEPMLAKKTIYRLIDHYGNKVKFGIQTNGTLLDKDDVDFFLDSDVGMGISLDPTNDSRRKQLTREMFFKLFDRSSLQKIGIISTITCRNVTQLVPFIEELYDLGISSVVLNPVFPENQAAKQLVPDLNALIENYIKAVDALITLNRKSAHKLVIDNIEGFLLPLISDYNKSYCRMSPCGAGRLNLVVTQNGDVYPCSGFVGSPQFCIGNIFNSDFRYILNSSVCRHLRARETSKIKYCKDCIYRKICGANCPIALQFLHGDMYMKSFYCKFYKKILDYLLYKISQSIDNLSYLISDSYLSSLNESENYYEIK